MGDVLITVLVVGVLINGIMDHRMLVRSGSIYVVKITGIVVRVLSDLNKLIHSLWRLCWKKIYWSGKLWGVDRRLFVLVVSFRVYYGVL